MTTFTLSTTHGAVELTADRIFCDGAMFPPSIDGASRYNPRNISAWVIGHAAGAVAMVFAANDMDALDTAADAGLMAHFEVDPTALTYDDETGEVSTDAGGTVAFLGNADEPHCLDDSWIAQVEWEAERDILTITAIIRADAAGDAYPAD